MSIGWGSPLTGENLALVWPWSLVSLVLDRVLRALVGRERWQAIRGGRLAHGRWNRWNRCSRLPAAGPDDEQERMSLVGWRSLRRRVRWSLLAPTWTYHGTVRRWRVDTMGGNAEE